MIIYQIMIKFILLVSASQQLLLNRWPKSKCCGNTHIENCCIADMIEEDDPGSPPGSVEDGTLNNALQTDVENLDLALGVPDTTSSLKSICCCLACRKDKHK